MSRVLNIDAPQAHVIATCSKKHAEISAIETLRSGGTRVVLTNAIDTATILERGEAWIPLSEGIVASFNTEPARAEGLRRLAFLKAHYAQLRREWNDPMLPSTP